MAAQPAAGAGGADEQRGLGQRLGLERGRCERGGADHAGPGRLAGRGIEDVMPRRAVLRRATGCRSRPDVATAPSVMQQPMHGLAGERMPDVDVERLAVRRTDPQVAATVDRPPLTRGKAGGRADPRRGPCRCRQYRTAGPGGRRMAAVAGRGPRAARPREGRELRPGGGGAGRERVRKRDFGLPGGHGRSRRLQARRVSVGSTSPPVRTAAHRAPATAVRSSGEAGDLGRLSAALSRQRSLSGRKRLSAAS